MQGKPIGWQFTGRHLFFKKKYKMVKFNEKALSELKNNEHLKLEIMQVTGKAYSTVNRWIYKKNINKLGTIAINETIKKITGENLINF